MGRTQAEHERLVRWFSELMLETLRRNGHKPHWLTMSGKERAAVNCKQAAGISVTGVAVEQWAKGLSVIAGGD